MSCVELLSGSCIATIVAIDPEWLSELERVSMGGYKLGERVVLN